MKARLPARMVEDDAPAKERHRDAAIQRVRVGLTGLAAVFLLTLLAASIFNMLGQDDHSAKLANGVVANNGAVVPDVPKEPLAELGVAPGGNTPRPAPASQKNASEPRGGGTDAAPVTIPAPPAPNLGPNSPAQHP
ncbi:hypothetical protein [Sphingomonas abietis]|uniref:SPOR domain-containing protein n=1 Tax=Sphingomonas abietis TaxID=3012344 RepID=A0ABY7NPC4_9SPHN|nr:hypothetical protein [Sphingomonas abietis]WBO23382.1 hypothetical protein PBT88_04420 [Sphingomonas abietis]